MRKSFTLVEMLIVIAIIALMTVGAVSALTNFMRSARLNAAEEHIRALIASARNSALVGDQITDATDADNDDQYDDTVVAHSYGLQIRLVTPYDLRRFNNQYDAPGVAEKYSINEEIEKYDVKKEFGGRLILCPSEPAVAYTLLYTPLTAELTVFKNYDPTEKISYSPVNQKLSFSIEEGKTCGASNPKRIFTLSLQTGILE